MEQKQILQDNIYSQKELIPAFLAPDYIISNNYPNTGLKRPYHDSEVDTSDGVASEMVIRERLHYALEQQHIDLFMQPIVILPQRHNVFYEFFGRLRIKPGQYIPAVNYIELANQEHIISRLDTLFLTHCLKTLKKQRLRINKFTSYFINIKPFTLRNHGFISNLVSILSNDKDIANAIIFEMHYNDFQLLSPAEKKIIDELSKIGCRFSLDHVDDILCDIKILKERHISFVKIEGKAILNKGRTDKGFYEVINKNKMLKEHNIDLIIEKIETEAGLIELLDYDIRYGQGFLFGRPDFSGIYT